MYEAAQLSLPSPRELTRVWLHPLVCPSVPLFSSCLQAGWNCCLILFLLSSWRTVIIDWEGSCLVLFFLTQNALLWGTNTFPPWELLFPSSTDITVLICSAPKFFFVVYFYLPRILLLSRKSSKAFPPWPHFKEGTMNKCRWKHMNFHRRLLLLYPVRLMHVSIYTGLGEKTPVGGMAWENFSEFVIICFQYPIWRIADTSHYVRKKKKKTYIQWQYPKVLNEIHVLYTPSWRIIWIPCTILASTSVGKWEMSVCRNKEVLIPSHPSLTMSRQP